VAKGRSSGSLRCWSDGFRSREFCIRTLKLASLSDIQGVVDTWAPARQAASVDPLAALRQDWFRIQREQLGGGGV